MKTEYKGLVINSTFKGDKKAAWEGIDNWNNHIISISNNETNARTRFDFWASNMNPHINSKKELLWAFECFVRDAVSGQQDFESFCGEFGYDMDSRTAYKTWKACVRSYEKLTRVYDGDIYSLSDELNN